MKTNTSFNGKEIEITIKLPSVKDLFDNWDFINKNVNGVIVPYKLKNMDYNTIAKIVADKYIKQALDKCKKHPSYSQEMQDYDEHCHILNFYTTPFGLVMEKQCTNGNYEDIQTWSEFCLLSDFTKQNNLKLYEFEVETIYVEDRDEWLPNHLIDYREEKRIPIYKLYPFFNKGDFDDER